MVFTARTNRSNQRLTSLPSNRALEQRSQILRLTNPVLVGLIDQPGPHISLQTAQGYLT